jgi:carbon storage regulator CsrA
MLIISRKEGQRIVLPSLGVAVKILKTSGNSTRIGIDAPRSISVIREELLGDAEKLLDSTSDHLAAEEIHRLRGSLNSAAMGLNLLYRMLEQGETEKASATILRVFSQLREIETVVAAGSNTGESSTSVPLQSDISSNNVRALIVEDNQNECELFAAFLRSYGVNADTATNGRKALERLSSSNLPYDIVLLDMQMPELNGAETVARIRSQRRLDGIRVFAVSGSPQKEFNVPIGSQGVDRWFTKPVESDELIARMFMDLQREPA